MSKATVVSAVVTDLNKEAHTVSDTQRTLVEWTLPNSGELVYLEVYRKKDGFDASRLVCDFDRKDWIGAQVKLTQERGEPLSLSRLTDQCDADKAYISNVIDKQATFAAREYFLGRMTGRPPKPTPTSGGYPYRRRVKRSVNGGKA